MLWKDACYAVIITLGFFMWQNVLSPFNAGHYNLITEASVMNHGNIGLAMFSLHVVIEIRK